MFRAVLLVAAFLFLARPVAVQVYECALSVGVGVQWTDRNDERLVAVQLNFTSETGIPAPWSFEIQSDPIENLTIFTSWDWSQKIDAGSAAISGIATGYWQVLNITPVALGAVLSYDEAFFEEKNASGVKAFVNGRICSVSVVDIDTTPASASVQGTAIQPMRTQDGLLIGVEGLPIHLLGVNWFGWADSTSFFDGLWQGPTSLTLDFATVVYRLQLLGANAVRVVFSFQTVFKGSPQALAGNCPTTQQSAILDSVTDPDARADTSVLPAQRYPITHPSGTCNTYLPSDSVFDAFVEAIRLLASNGFYIILDNQSQSDDTVITDTAQWVRYWVELMQTLWRDPATASYVIVDAFNEPDYFDIRWEPYEGRPGAHQLYTRVWDAIYDVAPNTMFGFEGLGQTTYAQNWGNGLVTDSQIIASNGLSDPNPFFADIIRKPYLDKLVAIPHVYGPSVSMARSGFSGQPLFEMLSNSMGYLNRIGYCPSGGGCQKFPIVLGETGFDPTNSDDLAFIASLSDYINANGEAEDGVHNALSGALLWCWNQNTNGNLQILGKDWATIDWTKIRWLESIGLAPWYAPQSKTSPGGAPVASIQSTSSSLKPALDQSPGLQIKGVVWPGFDSLMTGPAGSISTDLNSVARPVARLDDPDFASTVQVLYALGFDTVVLPFTFAGLDAIPQPWNTTCTTTVEQYRAILLPEDGLSYALPNVPTLPYQVAGTCNSYLPNITTTDRLLFVVDYLARNNFYVVLQNRDEELATNAPETWLSRMVELTAMLPQPQNIVLNALTSSSLSFESNAGRPGLSDLYLTLLDGVTNAVPDLAGYILQVPTATSSRGINPAFLQSLSGKAYANRVLYARNVDVALNETVVLDISGEFDAFLQQFHDLTLSGWVWNNSVDADQAGTLVDVGLRPWFLPASPNRTATAVRTVSYEPLQVPLQVCSVNITQLSIGETDDSEEVSLLQFDVSNTAETTVFPPWTLAIAHPNITAIVQAFGIGDVRQDANGRFLGRADRFWTTLWPNAKNYHTIMIISNVEQQPLNLEAIAVQLNGNDCEAVLK